MSTKLHDNALGLLFIDNVQHILHSQGLKVQLVSNIEVSGYGFGVVVDDDGFIAHLFERPYAVYGAVVKLYALTDTDRTGAQYNNLLFVTNLNLVLSFVAGIVVRSSSLKLGSTCIYHLVGGDDAVSLTHIANFKLSLAYASSNGLVGKAHLLSLAQQAGSELMGFHSTLHFDDVLNLGQEPSINLSDGVDFVNGYATAHSLSDYKATFIINILDFSANFFIAQSLQLGHFQVGQANFQAAYCLQHGSFHSTLNSHNLAGSLHLGTQSTVGGNKFIKGPTGEFQNDVVDGRLKASLGLLGNSVFNFVQIIAHSNLTGNLSDGIAGRLRSQGGGTAYAGVNLDYIIVFRIGVQCQLYVAATNYAQFADDINGSLAQHLHFFIIQGLSRSHNDGVTGVHTYGVQIFHGADGDAVVNSVADNLKFDFLPASDGAFNQALADGAITQALLYNINQLILIFSNTATGAAKSIGRTNNQRIANLTTEGAGSHNGFYNSRFRNGLMDFFHRFLEHFAVLATFNGGDLGAQQAYLVLAQNALLFQLHSHVQANLAA